MRDIIFRGKRLESLQDSKSAYGPTASFDSVNRTRRLRTDNVEWVKGFYVHMPVARDGDHIIESGGTDYTIDIATLGQYIGKRDAENTMIFEGDIVEYAGTKFVVQYIHRFAAFSLRDVTNRYSPPAITPASTREMRVIGNIYDNKDIDLCMRYDYEEHPALEKIQSVVSLNPRPPKVNYRIYPRPLYYCPKCEVLIDHTDQWRSKFCTECGQAIDWAGFPPERRPDNWESYMGRYDWTLVDMWNHEKEERNAADRR